MVEQAAGSKLVIGTCSWKYDSWRGIIYPLRGKINYLQEYTKHYQSVEIDQWFWSLFKGSEVKLPIPETVREYKKSVPREFIFTVKVPNSITLTHFYRQNKGEPLEANPHFFSVDVFCQFLKRLQPLKSNLGPLMFQFEYLNKQKMPSQTRFLEQLEEFISHCPDEYQYSLEIRNPNYLNDKYFLLLQELGIQPIFVQGYYMPSIFELYQQYKQYIAHSCIIRLMGTDRQVIERLTGRKWSQIQIPRDKELDQLNALLQDLHHRHGRAYLYVNNHYEGSAPLTIKRIQHRIYSG